jgi:hypothetical protein
MLQLYSHINTKYKINSMYKTVLCIYFTIKIRRNVIVCLSTLPNTMAQFPRRFSTFFIITVVCLPLIVISVSYSGSVPCVENCEPTCNEPTPVCVPAMEKWCRCPLGLYKEVFTGKCLTPRQCFTAARNLYAPEILAITPQIPQPPQNSYNHFWLNKK